MCAACVTVRGYFFHDFSRQFFSAGGRVKLIRNVASRLIVFLFIIARIFSDSPDVSRNFTSPEKLGGALLALLENVYK